MRGPARQNFGEPRSDTITLQEARIQTIYRYAAFAWTKTPVYRQVRRFKGPTRIARAEGKMLPVGPARRLLV